MAEAKRQHDWNVASTIMALMAEMNRDRKRRRKPFKPDDFNPYADKKPMLLAELLSKLLRCSVQTFNKNFRVTMSQVRGWRSLRRADREEHAVPQGARSCEEATEVIWCIDSTGRYQTDGSWHRGSGSDRRQFGCLYQL